MRRTTRRRGATMLLVAIIMLVLVGFVGLAIDYGYVHFAASQLQVAADASALAGARQVKISRAQARTAAIDLASKNYVAGKTVTLSRNDSNDTAGDIVVGIYDLETKEFLPSNTDDANAVRITARRNSTVAEGPLSLLFGPIFGRSSVDMTRTSTAVIEAPPDSGIILLKDKGDKALEVKKKGNITVEGDIYINANGKKALEVSGDGNIDADGLYIRGGYSVKKKAQLISPVYTGSPLITDPLITLPAPLLSEHAIRSSAKLKIDNRTIELLPGRYRDGIEIKGKSKVTLKPGIYIMEGGGISVTGEADLIAKEVMLYNTGKNNGTKDVKGIHLHGEGEMSWTPPKSGIYKGISIFHDRRVKSEQLHLHGRGDSVVHGTIYAPRAKVNITGDASLEVIGGLYIAWEMDVTRDADLNISGGGAETAEKVYLVQ